MIVERVKPEDLERILELQKAAFLAEADIYGACSVPPLRQTSSEIEEEFKNKVFLKAVLDGKIVGSVRGYEKDGECSLEKLIVDPAYQNRGIGGKLMTALEREFPRASFFKLSTGHKSAKNIHLYTKLGYSLVRREKKTETLDFVHMIKLHKNNMSPSMDKIIDLYYFSGTGNTLLAARTFAEAISKKGLSVNLLRLEKSDPGKIDPTRTIGLAFPVAMSTYPLVWDFVHALPKTTGTRIFMLATMGGDSIGLVGKMRNILTGKGYTPIGAHQAKMPPNVFFILNDNTNKKRVESGLASVRNFAEKIADGRARWPSIPILSDIAYSIYRGVVSLWKAGWHQKSFRFAVESKICTKCALCAKLCPVGNIKLEPYPVFGLKCQYCMRCISYCPAKAIRSKFQYKNRTYKATPTPYENGGDNV